MVWQQLMRALRLFFWLSWLSSDWLVAPAWPAAGIDTVAGAGDDARGLSYLAVRRLELEPRPAASSRACWHAGIAGRRAGWQPGPVGPRPTCLVPRPVPRRTGKGGHRVAARNQEQACAGFVRSPPAQDRHPASLAACRRVAAAGLCRAVPCHAGPAGAAGAAREGGRTP